MGNLMQSVYQQMDETCELEVVQFSPGVDGAVSFHFIEQSSLQVLREIPADTSIEVVKVFSQRHRIVQKTSNIKAARTAAHLINVLVPLVENGSLPLDELILVLNGDMHLQSFNDFHVKLASVNLESLVGLIKTIFIRNNYSVSLLNDIMNQPKLYHRIVHSNQITGSFKTLEEALDRL